MRGSTQNLGPIGSAVLSFIGYKRTDTQTDIHTKYIYIYMLWMDRFTVFQLILKEIQKELNLRHKPKFSNPYIFARSLMV